jgi:hypothetical protein
MKFVEISALNEYDDRDVSSHYINLDSVEYFRDGKYEDKYYINFKTTSDEIELYFESREDLKNAIFKLRKAFTRE